MEVNQARDGLLKLTKEEMKRLEESDPEAWKRFAMLAICAGVSKRIKEQFNLGTRGVRPWLVGGPPTGDVAAKVVRFAQTAVQPPVFH